MLKTIENLKFLAIGLIFTFLLNSLGPVPLAQAQDFALPQPGIMVNLSPAFAPPVLKGIKVHPDNPFRFEFILDKGDGQLNGDLLKSESARLIKYFLASLTIPEKDLWVNLSPYEKDRIVTESFGQTEMGRDLLAEDYMLKQITASLIYPEGETGKRFWQRIYAEAAKRFGTTNIPVNTFNKVWIVPEKAVVYENAKAGTAYVVNSKLKVMLEQDYLSLQKHDAIGTALQVKDTNQLGSQIVREIVIPELTKEVNEDRNFSQLRQVYNSLILATWYKKKIKDSILEQVYADRNKVAGVNIDDPQEKQRIYDRYLQAFKKGVFNFIKEEADASTQETIPRKYFSGGMLISPDSAMTITRLAPQDTGTLNNLVIVSSQVDAAMNSNEGGKPVFETKMIVKNGQPDVNIQKEIITEVKWFAERNHMDWESRFSENEESLAEGLWFVVENLMQHEYDKRSPIIYYRIYRSSQPVDGIRLEFWGPAKQPFPRQFKDEATQGIEYKWFDSYNRPWNSIKAPEDAIQGGVFHIGVSLMFGYFKGLVKVGWREDRKEGGHIIAIHFPMQHVIVSGAEKDRAMNGFVDKKKNLLQLLSRKPELSKYYQEYFPFLRAIGLNKGKKVIDVWSLNNWFMPLAVAALGANYIGFDLHEEYVTTINEMLSSYKFDEFGVVQARLGKFSFGSPNSKDIQKNSQDFVFILTGALSDPWPESSRTKVLKEALRVVRDGGKIVVGTIGSSEWEEPELQNTLKFVLGSPRLNGIVRLNDITNNIFPSNEFKNGSSDFVVQEKQYSTDAISSLKT